MNSTIPHIGTKKRMPVVSLGLLIGLVMAAGLPASGKVRVPAARSAAQTALLMSNYLLKQQNADGVMPDGRGWDIANEDSNMEYALIGLAAAYAATGDSRYLTGLEKGICWLADREETADVFWRGSWMYAYSVYPPYLPVPTSPGPGIRDVRGVDATSALFAYLLHLHQRLTGRNDLVLRYGSQARSALDFLLARNQAGDGFIYSSWQQNDQTGEWTLWPFQYTADQADVYLGFQAGWLLFQDTRYLEKAAFLRLNTPRIFFDSKRGRFGLGRDEFGTLDSSMEGFNGIFPQGYLAWVFGPTPETRAALAWLRSKVRSDGSITATTRAPAYSLSAATLIMGAYALAEPQPLSTIQWLQTVPFDPKDGGVRDTANRNSTKFTNVTGFSALSLLGFLPF